MRLDLALLARSHGYSASNASNKSRETHGCTKRLTWLFVNKARKYSSVCSSQTHAEDSSPKIILQLLGGCLLPSLSYLAGFQMYQERLGWSFDDRDSLNQLCLRVTDGQYAGMVTDVVLLGAMWSTHLVRSMVHYLARVSRRHTSA